MSDITTLSSSSDTQQFTPIQQSYTMTASNITEPSAQRNVRHSNRNNTTTTADNASSNDYNDDMLEMTDYELARKQRNRVKHIESETRRRTRLRDQITKLTDILQCSKRDTYSVLDSAINCIIQLKQQQHSPSLTHTGYIESTALITSLYNIPSSLLCSDGTIVCPNQRMIELCNIQSYPCSIFNMIHEAYRSDIVHAVQSLNDLHIPYIAKHAITFNFNPNIVNNNITNSNDNNSQQTKYSNATSNTVSNSATLLLVRLRVPYQIDPLHRATMLFMIITIQPYIPSVQNINQSLQELAQQSTISLSNQSQTQALQPTLVNRQYSSNSQMSGAISQSSSLNPSTMPVPYNTYNAYNQQQPTAATHHQQYSHMPQYNTMPVPQNYVPYALMQQPNIIQTMPVPHHTYNIHQQQQHSSLTSSPVTQSIQQPQQQQPAYSTLSSVPIPSLTIQPSISQNSQGSNISNQQQQQQQQRSSVIVPKPQYPTNSAFTVTGAHTQSATQLPTAGVNHAASHTLKSPRYSTPDPNTSVNANTNATAATTIPSQSNNNTTDVTAKTQPQAQPPSNTDTQTAA